MKAPRSVSSARYEMPKVSPLKMRSEEHTSELQSRRDLVCRLLLEKKNDRIRAGEQKALVVVVRAARPRLLPAEHPFPIPTLGSRAESVDGAPGVRLPESLAE